MSDFLQAMAAGSQQRVASAKRQTPLAALVDGCASLEAPATLDHAAPGMRVIAEIKVRSPAEGRLEHSASMSALLARAQQYIDAGAAALSVLTEPERFDGSLEHLSAIAARAHAVGVPVMRKDFLVDAYQIYEGRLAGADGVLLIARLLSDKQLQQMLDAARQLNMFVLLEAFDREDLERSGACVDTNVLIGLNCRDLTTLQIEPARFAQLIDFFPENCVRVAESGIHSAADAVALAQTGYDMALIGTALMKAANPHDLITQIRQQTTAGKRL